LEEGKRFLAQHSSRDPNEERANVGRGADECGVPMRVRKTQKTRKEERRKQLCLKRMLDEIETSP